MDDLISRQAAIDEVAKALKGVFVEYQDVAEKIINKVPSATQSNTSNALSALDCIDRQAAIGAIKDILGLRNPNWFPNKTEEEVLLSIKNLPPAQPERKRGRWIERNPLNAPECRLIECSECGNGYIVDMGLLLEDWAEGRNFCIRCGADMRGEEV